MAKWSFEIYDQTGERVADLIGKTTQRRIVKTRNRSDVISLTLDLDDVKELCVALNMSTEDIFACNQNAIRAKRGGVVISACEISGDEPVVDEENRTITVQSVGWLDYLGARKIDDPVSFSQIDAGQIFWSLIDTAQQREYGDYGITQGNIQASVPRDRNYEANKNIKDAGIQLSEVQNGFDFEITWDKKLNVYYPKQGTRLTEIVLSYPGNIASLGAPRSGLSMANEVTARGAGTGGEAFEQVAIDVLSASKYHLRQSVVDFADVSLDSTLQEHANEELNSAAKFIDIPTITLEPNSAPEFGSYGIGDELRVSITKDLEVFRRVDDFFRIDGMIIDIPDDDQEIVQLKLAK